MSELSNAVTPTFNKTIKQIGEVDDRQSNVDLIAIADKAVAQFGASVSAAAGNGMVILSTQEMLVDGVVKYDGDIVVVIKDGQAVWIGRGLDKFPRDYGKEPWT
jgi:hypothetical protein